MQDSAELSFCMHLRQLGTTEPVCKSVQRDRRRCFCPGRQGVLHAGISCGRCAQGPSQGLCTQHWGWPAAEGLQAPGAYRVLPPLLAGHDGCMPERQAQQVEGGADGAGVLSQRAAQGHREDDLEDLRPCNCELLHRHLHTHTPCVKLLDKIRGADLMAMTSFRICSRQRLMLSCNKHCMNSAVREDRNSAVHSACPKLLEKTGVC